MGMYKISNSVPESVVNTAEANLAEENKVKIGNNDNNKLKIGGSESKTFRSSCSNSGENVIIAVISNKGGVGKTSLAVIISMYCAEKIGKKTLLLELDSSPGDFGSLFDIRTDKSLELALRFPKKYKNYIENIYRNLDVLKGISNPLVAEGVKKGIIYNLLEHVCSDYKFIIVDNQTIINGVMLDMLRISSTIFVVSDYSLESISRISNLIDMLVDKFSIPKSRIKIIINKKQLFSFLKIGDVSKIIEFPIEAFVSLDRRFDKSIFLFNRRKILGTRFFKEVSKMLSKHTYYWS